MFIKIFKIIICVSTLCLTTSAFVRLSKPTLPPPLQKNYDKIANEKTALKALMEEKKRLAQENENKIKCGAKDGVKMIFDTVEVVNHLNPVGVYETVKRFGENYDKIVNEHKLREEEKKLAKEKENIIMVAKAEGEARRIAKEKENKIMIAKAERELHSHPGEAYIHILVGLGSCLFTMILILTFKD